MQETGHPPGSAGVDRLLKFLRVLSSKIIFFDAIIFNIVIIAVFATKSPPIGVGAGDVPHPEPGRNAVPPGRVRGSSVGAATTAVIGVPQS